TARRFRRISGGARTGQNPNMALEADSRPGQAKGISRELVSVDSKGAVSQRASVRPARGKSQLRRLSHPRCHRRSKMDRYSESRMCKVSRGHRESVWTQPAGELRYVSSTARTERRRGEVFDRGRHRREKIEVLSRVARSNRRIGTRSKARDRF